MTLDLINRYRPAAVALQYLKQDDGAGAAGALEKLVETVDFGEDGRILADAVMEQTEGNKLFASAYGRQYQEALHGANVTDLFGFYDAEFREYLDEAHYTVAKEIFAGYDKKYGNILNEVMKAEETIKSKRTDISEDDREKAKKVIKKYQPIVLPLESFEQLRREAISNPIDKSTLKETLAEMYKPAEEEQ